MKQPLLVLVGVVHFQKGLTGEVHFKRGVEVEEVCESGETYQQLFRRRGNPLQTANHRGSMQSQLPALFLLMDI